MSKLTELLDELCPDGVEYRVLGDLTELSIGKFVKKTKQRDDFEYPVYNGGAEPTGYFSEWNAEADSIVIAARGSIGFVNFVTTKFWAGNSSYVLKNLGESIDRRYLYHYLKHHEHDLYKLRSTGSIPAINKKPLSQMLIGIPPLEVQQEIVRVLDAFTDLEQSLVSELELRKKQFEEYRDELLSFTPNVVGLCPDEVEYVAAGEIAQIGTGSSDRKDAVEDGGFPFFVRSETVMRHSEYEYDETAIVIPGEGGVGEIFHYVSGKYALHQRAYRVSFTTDAIDTRFAFYHFQAKFKRFIEKVAVTATVKSIRKPMLTKFPIPIPPMEVQKKIAAKLDAFSDLIQSIEQEINLRRTQYEFYRDELLSFAPKED